MRYEIEGKLLSDIGDAIREKTGKSGLILPGDMPGYIDGIKPNLQSKTTTVNGTVVPDAGYDGLSSVVIDVQSSGVGTLEITSNGVYDISNYASVVVNVPNISKIFTITANGGRNGGAVITVAVDGDEIFQAVGQGTYNNTYDKLHDTIDLPGFGAVGIDINVTGQTKYYVPVVTITGPSISESVHFQYLEANSSYGYGDQFSYIALW